MIDTARLIITMDCKRNCPDCCNKTDPSVKLATTINNLATLKDYKIICITGGEPMLNKYKTLDIIQKLKVQNPNSLLYLYTAWCEEKTRKTLAIILDFINGIHYTLHYPYTLDDMINFNRFQKLVKNEGYDTQTFRLYIDNRIDSMIVIQPDLWHRVEIKPWMKECSLPSNEKLFILEG
jgi:organic radical activating enzyme